MRVLSAQEKKQRGCCCCANVGKTQVKGQARTVCPFTECAYSVLDKYESYEAFMESDDCKILVDEFFQSVADCYALSKLGKKVSRYSSDGDAVREL